MIPVAKPTIGSLEKKNVKSAIDSGWVSGGKFVNLFEKEIKKLIKAKYAVSCSNGTISLIIALRSLNIGLGDEVIVPDISYVATINAVINVGATPVIIEVDKKTWCIDPNKIEKRINKRTKAIICVHLFGNCCDMNELLKIKKKHGIFIIEDAAESFGCKFNNKLTGSIGDIGCFSFFGNKTITCGEGGACATNNKKIYEKMLLIKNNGHIPRIRYYSFFPGLNYRITNIQAAIGFSQIKKLKTILAKRKKIQKKYDNELKKLNQVIFQKVYKNNTKIEWLYTVLIKNCNVKNLANYLNKKKIETRPMFPPFHTMKIYKKYIPKDFDKTNSLFLLKFGISLPTFTDLKIEKINYICKNIKKFLASNF